MRPDGGGARGHLYRYSWPTLGVSRARAIALVLLAVPALAALPYPLHDIGVNTPSATACPGDEVRVNLTLSSLADQQLVVRVVLESPEGVVVPSSATFSLGAGANLTRVVAARVAPNATRGAYRLRATASLDGKGSLRAVAELPLDVRSCAAPVPVGGEGSGSRPALLGVLALALVAAMALLVVRASAAQPAPRQQPWQGYQQVPAGYDPYRRW